jgi:hypothetical protein
MKPNKRHHGGTLKRPRLKIIMGMLDTGRIVTALQIHHATNSIAPSCDIADIRALGYPVSKANYLRTTDNGCHVNYWFKKKN